MNSKAKFGVSLIGIGLGATVLIGYLGTRKTDQELIQEALNAAIAAGREGRPGSVLEHLSASFEINGQSIMNREQVARFIHDNKPNVEVETKVAQVSGDFAFILTPVRLSMAGPINLGSTIPDVRIEFQKEHTTKFLLIPDRQWRLTKVSVPIESWSQMMGF